LTILPNPLVKIAQIDTGAGAGLDLRSLEWILHGGQDDSCLLDRLTRINVTATAALDSKADLGISLPPNQLVGRLHAYWQGLGLVWGPLDRYCVWGGATTGRRLGWNWWCRCRRLRS